MKKYKKNLLEAVDKGENEGDNFAGKCLSYDISSLSCGFAQLAVTKYQLFNQ